MMLAPGTVQADILPVDANSKLSDMQSQIDALNKRVERLERTLQPDLTPSTPNTTGAGVTTTQPPPTTPTRGQPELRLYQELEVLRANWKRLERGLSRTELRQLLGEPRSELAFGQQTLWYYSYPGIGSGSVMLDHKGKTSSWQEPPFRGW